MRGQKMLLAVAAEEFISALTQELKGQFEIRVSRTGMETMEMLESFHPDVIVLDVMLPNIDGITALQTARSRGCRSRVLAIVPMDTKYVLESLARLNTDYAMVKPVKLDALVARIRDVSGFDQRQEPIRLPPEEQVTKILLKLGIPTKPQGYLLLRMGVLHTAYHPGCLVTKEVYPRIASACGGTTTHVEQCIRRLIENTWKKRKGNAWEELFPNNLEHWPSNGEFMNRIAMELRMDDRDLPDWK